jgi:hypothetical protein
VTKVWTPAARKAFAAKMKRARAAARGRRKNPKAKLRIAHITDYSRGGQGFTALVRGKRVIGRYTNMADAQAAYKRARARRKNPTKDQVKAAAKKIAAGAAKLAWRGAKLTGRAGKAGAKAAAAEVKASICRPRAANPKRKKVWTAAMRAAFARRMAKYRRHPKAKRIARKRVRRRNPFRVVIKAVPKGEYRKRRKNPTAPLYYDGRNFTSNKAKRRTFSSVQPAEVVARQLLHRYPVLRKGYVVTLNSV